MSTQEVVPVAAFVGETVIVVARLREMRHAAETELDPDAVADLTDRTRMAREWLRITNAADEIRVEAVRLEMVGMRRIAQLGTVQVFRSGARREAAAKFAQLGDKRFAELLDEVVADSTPTGIFKRYMEQQYADTMMRRMKETVDGRRVIDGPASSPYDRERIDRAVRTLLDVAAVSDSEPVRVTDAAEAVAEALGIHAPDIAQRDGLAKAVLSAMNRAQIDDVEVRMPKVGHVKPPRWVTYFDDLLGWVHVPFSRASLGQFREMLSLRRMQAADLERQAERLAAVFQVLLDDAQPHGPEWETLQKLRCGQVWNDAVKAALPGTTGSPGSQRV